MNLNLNLSSFYLDKTNVANSLIFYLYHKHQRRNSYYKSINNIQGLYKDPILKESIYISSTGLKKNAIFKRSEINENILNSKINSFISYFSNLEDNLFKFNIYPQKYFKDITTQYFYQKQLITHYQKKLLNLRNIKLKSKFLKNYILYGNVRQQTVFGNFDKLILLKSLYQKIIFATSKGFVKDLTNNFSERLIFTGLTYILKKNIKDAFVNVLLLNYLLIKYYSNTSLSWKKNSNTLYNIIIYFNFWKYSNTVFNEFLTEKKLKLRKSNIFLKKYQNFFTNKINKFIKLYYFIALKRNIFQNSVSWVQEFVFNKYQNIFSKNTEEVDNQVLFNKINSLSVFEKTSVFKFIFLFLKIKVMPLFFDIDLKSKFLTKYISLKGFILQVIFNTQNLHIYSPVQFTYDLFFLKIKLLANTLYSNQSYIFYNTKVFGYNLLLKKNKKTKFLCKRKSSFPYHFYSEKINLSKRKDLILKRKNSLLKNNKVNIFLKYLFNLNTPELNHLRSILIKKIAYKRRKQKKIYYSPLYKKLKFNNFVMSQLLLKKS